MRVSLVQLAVQTADPAANGSKVETLVAAEAGQADLVLLPELWSTGYCLDRLVSGGLAEPVDGPSLALLGRLAKQHSLYLYGSTAVQREGRVYNLATLFGPTGDRLAEYAKVHLVPMLNEHLHLAPGARLAAADLGGTKAGLAICYDLRFPELARSLTLQGAELLLITAQWPTQRIAHWRALCIARAIENQAYVLACNGVGGEEPNRFGGHSLVVSPWGEVLAEAGEEEKVLRAQLDLSLVGQVREQVPSLRGRRPELY